MRGVMASNSSSLTHNVQAPSRPPPRDRSPDPPVGRSGCCTGFLCLGSLKRGKRIAPTTRMHDSSNTSPRPWASNGGAQQSGPANQYATLSPSLLAPPSSPASFQNSAVQSSAQSPCSFPVVSVPSATSQIPLERAQTMFQMGPYAHETALVSPPVFSNFTTAPSTAPFTPPPELANTHLTTPSSPDVPFAQLLANSFGTKQRARSQPTRTYSALPFASPDMFERDDLQVAYQLYPGSPLAHLLSPASGTGASTPFPDLEPPTPVQAVASMFFPGSPLIQQDPPSRMELQVLNSCSFHDLGGQGEQQLPATISSFLASGDDTSGPKVDECTERLIVDVNKGSEVCLVIEHAGLVGSAAEKDGLQEEKSAPVARDCISKQDIDTGVTGFVLGDPISPTHLEQSKRESSDQVDRNLREGAPCIQSFTEAFNKSPSAGIGASDDSSPADQGKGNFEFSDEVDRNLAETAIPNLSSSDVSDKAPGIGNDVLCDNPSDQQKEGKYEFSCAAARSVNQTDESTCEGSSGSDEVIFARLGRCEQELSDEADRNVYEIVTFNIVRKVKKQFPGESNGHWGEVSSVHQEPGKSDECTDELERNLRQTVLGLLGSTVSANCNSPRQGNVLVESNGRQVQTLVRSATLLGPTIGDLVAWEASIGDKIPAKLSISKISLMEANRTGRANL